eukprot:jgi/Chlat1/582/Chrsp103S01023
MGSSTAAALLTRHSQPLDNALIDYLNEVAAQAISGVVPERALADTVRAFLPGAGPAELDAAVQQLLHEGRERARPTTDVRQPPAGMQRDGASPPASAPAPHTAPSSALSSAAGQLGLNPRAKEFVPTFGSAAAKPVAPVIRVAQQHDLDFALPDSLFSPQPQLHNDNDDDYDAQEEYGHGGGVVVDVESAVVFLSEQFPSYDPASLRAVLLASGCDLEHAIDGILQLEEDNSRPVELTPADFPALSGGAVVEPTLSSSPGVDFASVGSQQQQQQQQLSRTSSSSSMMHRHAPPPRTTSLPADAVRWLDTGDAVASLYARHRAEARDHARVRNACFQQATQAYLSGQRALARELGAKGRWHNEQMKRAHEAASAHILRHRNDGRANDARLVLDLHGLHVPEALAALRARLDTASTGALYVVVGTGHHGRVPARLPAAVKQLLDARRVPYHEPQPGMLHVALPTNRR